MSSCFIGFFKKKSCFFFCHTWIDIIEVLTRVGDEENDMVEGCEVLGRTKSVSLADPGEHLGPPPKDPKWPWVELLKFFGKVGGVKSDVR